MAFDLGSVIAHVKADISDFKKKMGIAKKETKSLNAGVKKTAAGFKTAAVAIAGFAGAAGLGALAKGSVEAAAKMEQTRISFNAMVGDVEKAGKLMKDLVEFANVTPFETFDVTDAGKSLLAYGITADEVQGTLKKIGDVAAGANVPIKDMASIFGKIRSGGLVFTEDLNQLGDRGIPILQVLAEMYNETGGQIVTVGGSSKKTRKQVGRLTEKLGDQNFKLKQMKDAGKEGSDSFKTLERSIGKTNSKLGDLGPITAGVSKKVKLTSLDIRDMASKGKITADDMEKAFEKMSGAGGMFEDLMAKQSETINGKLSTISGKFQILQVTIGEKLFPVIKPVLEQIIFLIEKMMAVASGATSVRDFFEQLGLPMEKVDTIIKQITDAAQLFANMFEIVVMPSIRELAVMFNEELLPELKKLWEMIGPVIPPLLKAMAVIFSTVLLVAVRLIAEGLELFIEVLIRVVRFVNWAVEGIVGFFQWLFDVLVGNSIIPDLIDKIVGFFSGMKDRVTGALSGMKDAIVAPFEAAANKIREIADNIRDKISGAFDMDKRNSPSINDRLRMLKDGVSDTIGEIGFGTPPSAGIAAGIGSNGGGITINLAGANISSTQVASEYAELIGDQIMKRMQKNLRF